MIVADECAQDELHSASRMHCAYPGKTDNATQLGLSKLDGGFQLLVRT